MKSVIKVDHLRKSYKDIKAVNDISFRVYEGEIFGMLGPNGAGKTTTMEIVEGIRQADSGRVSVLGIDVRKNPRKVKSNIGVQLQTTSLYPRLSVCEVMSLFASFYPGSVSINKLIKLVDMEDCKKKRCGKLSGGQQQRLSIALALVNNPKVIFFDEPTSGLDPQSRHNIWGMIEYVRGKGKSVFITTHYMEEAQRLCDRVAIVDHGKIIATDAPDKLVLQHFQEEAIEFEVGRKLDDEDLRAVAGVTNVVQENGKVTVYSNAVPVSVAALLDMAKQRGFELTNLYVRRATLEDVFLKLTGRRIRE